MSQITVLSLGGSIIAPDGVDVEFLKSFKKAISGYLNEDASRKLILVCGGGAPARLYQQAYRAITPDPIAEEQDWIGVQATFLNARLVKAVFSDYCPDPLASDPTTTIPFTGQILVAAGWKPGWSTDTDAVYLADLFGAKLIINLSNIAQVYTDDPKKNPEAKPLTHIRWKEFRAMVGDTWVPGKNTPFDPIASKLASEKGMSVISADGRNISNLLNILNGLEFFGTTISG